MEVGVVPRPMPELQQEGAEADQREQREAFAEDRVIELMDVDPQVVEQRESRLRTASDSHFLRALYTK
jgi:hypothetical protein